MHTTEDLASTSFVITAGDRRITVPELFPGFDERDRLGVVVRSPCSAVGASTLILATITAFYDIQRQRARDFFVYPDYFLFHTGGLLGDHRMFDIFPSHKEVVVGDSSEETLRAINDRAVTRLLVEDTPAGQPTFERPTLASTNIHSAIAYSPSGRVTGADLSVTGNMVTEGYVSDVLDQSQEVAATVREDIRARRKSILENGRPVETYRRLTVEEVLAKLAPEHTTVDAKSGSYPVASRTRAPSSSLLG